LIISKLQSIVVQVIIENYGLSTNNYGLIAIFYYKSLVVNVFFTKKCLD